MTRRIPVPSLSVFVAAAAVLSVTNGSMTSWYCFGSSPPDGKGDLRDTGMCECSGAHKDSKPRSSSARPIS